jgi:4a-hydroxytetrahydrobiopterin dehydratase
MDSNDLAKQQCVPCQGGVPPLRGKALKSLHEAVNNGWQLVRNHHLEKEYKFNNFREALDFTNRVGELAERQNHHPDIYLAWGRVKVSIWTHKIDGLTDSDFFFAAKTDQLLGATA